MLKDIEKEQKTFTTVVYVLGIKWLEFDGPNND